MNKSFLIGRLTRDPDMSDTPSGKRMARYTLAVDAYNDTDFISIVAFDKNAEFAEKYLFKGKRILVEGKIKTGSKEKDGQKVYYTNVVVDRHEFVDNKSDQNQNGIVQNGTINDNEFVPLPDDAGEEFPF